MKINKNNDNFVLAEIPYLSSNMPIKNITKKVIKKKENLFFLFENNLEETNHSK